VTGVLGSGGPRSVRQPAAARRTEVERLAAANHFPRLGDADLCHG
jgi:hypothetical protein